jgi:hypothetical protein
MTPVAVTPGGPVHIALDRNRRLSPIVAAICLRTPHFSHVHPDPPWTPPPGSGRRPQVDWEHMDRACRAGMIDLVSGARSLLLPQNMRCRIQILGKDRKISARRSAVLLDISRSWTALEHQLEHPDNNRQRGTKVRPRQIKMRLRLCSSKNYAFSVESGRLLL